MSLVEDQIELLEICATLGTDRLKLCKVVKSVLPDCACHGAFDWDIRTGSFRVSHSWTSMLGYDENDHHGRAEALLDLTHPDDKERLATTIYDYLRGIIGKYSVAVRMKRKDDTYMTVEHSGILISRNPDGSPGRLVGMSRSI